MGTKNLIRIQSNQKRHWVGDGFPVRSIFTYNNAGEEMSPFLLLDYAGPENFTPTHDKRGVGEHPHRGFETVTLIYDGEVEHRDSSGGGGKIGSGEVQWMTAASGVVHEEYHGTEYARRGGPFELIQLWVNLPARHKMDSPRYQNITNDSIPEVKLERGLVRVIAGEFHGKKGPAKTFSPVQMFDVRLDAGGKLELNIPDGWTTGLFVPSGAIRLESGERAGAADLVLFERAGSRVAIEAIETTKLLVLAGEPLNEPIVGYGPFVMNTQREIQQAFADYQSGKMGHLAPRTS